MPVTLASTRPASGRPATASARADQHRGGAARRRGAGRRRSLSVLVGLDDDLADALSSTPADPLHAIVDGPARRAPARRSPSAPRSGSPVPACRGSPATRWPTPGSSASTPAPRSRWCWRSPCFGVSDALGVRLVRVRRRRRRRWSPCTSIASLGRDGATPVKLAIAGAAVTAALTQLDVRGAAHRPRRRWRRFRFWQVGTRRRPRLRRAPDRAAVPRRSAPCWRSASARLLNALALGDDLARGLGRRTARRPAGARRGRACCWPARATALAGPIAFVGLIVPARRSAPSSAATTRRCCRCSLGYGAVLVVARRHRRPGRAAAGRGAGRDHDRRRRRAGVPGPGPPRPDGGAVMTAPMLDRAGRRGSTVDVGRPCVGRAAGARRAGTRLVVGGLSLALLAGRSRRGSCSATSRHDPRLLPDPRSATEIPGASLHPDGEQAAAGACSASSSGVAFGVGGAIFQTTLRNPLASPDIIGVSLGASAAAVFAIVALDQSGAAVSVAADRRRRRRRRASSAWSPGTGAGLPAGAGRDRRRRRAAVGDPVPLHPRRRVRRPAGAALADRQRQRRRLADDPAARAGSCWCCCRSWSGWRGRCG